MVRPSDRDRIEGVDGVRGKGERWAANHEVHDTPAEGPFVNGDAFAVFFRMDVTFKPSGERTKMDEAAAYKVKDGRIVEERFYY